METFNLIPEPWGGILIIILFCLTIYFTWRSGKNKENSEAVSNYKEVAESQEKRICQLEKDSELATKENKELRAQVNQLIGENKALKDLLTYQDPSFKKTIESMLEELKILATHQKELREDFLDHSKEDDRRFANLGKFIEDNNKRLKVLVPSFTK